MPRRIFLSILVFTFLILVAVEGEFIVFDATAAVKVSILRERENSPEWKLES